MMFISFSVLFVVSVAAINPGTYPVQREDFPKIPMPQHQPAGMYRVSRHDFIGFPEEQYPYPPYYYPAPRVYYWNPPRSYDYRSHDSRRPITPELPRLFIPHIPKTPVVTRKPTIPDFNDYDEGVLPATRGLSPSDESKPLAPVPVTFKRTSKQPDEYYFYNDDVEINAEQRDLLIGGFNRALAGETNESQKQADRFRRQAIFVIEATTVEDISAEDPPLYSAAEVDSNDDQKSVISKADPSDEFQYPAFYESMKRKKNYYLENNEIMDEEDNLSNQYSTKLRTTSEFPTEQVTSSTPAVDSDEDTVVIYEQQEIIISSNVDLPESVADPEVDYELIKEDKSSEIRESSTPEDDGLDAEFRDILEKLISMSEGANQQAEFSQGQSSDDRDDTITGLSRSPYDYEFLLETTTMVEDVDEVYWGTDVCDEFCLKLLSSLAPQKESPSPSEDEQKNEENSPDIILDSTTVTPIDTTTSEDMSDLYNFFDRILAEESLTSRPIDATEIADDVVSNMDLLASLLNEELNKESSTSTPVDKAALSDTNLMGFVKDQWNKNFGILKLLHNGTLIYEPLTQSTSTETSINDLEPEEEIDDFNTNSSENTEPPTTTTQNEDVVYGESVSSAEIKEILEELDRINADTIRDMEDNDESV